MSREIDEARRAVASRLREAAENVGYGTVETIDEHARICDVKVGGVVYEGVLLYAIEDEELKGFIPVPAIGSTVLVSRIGASSRLFVTMYSVIDKVLLTIGDTLDLVIDADGVRLKVDGIVINGGDNHGLVKIEELNDRLKSLEQKFNSHIHSSVIVAVSGGSGGPAVGTPGNSGAPTTSSNEFQSGYSEYENTKIRH